MNTYYILKPDHFSFNCFARSKFCQIFYWITGVSIEAGNRQIPLSTLANLAAYSITSEFSRFLNRKRSHFAKRLKILILIP